jgi:hypothetical protein
MFVVEPSGIVTLEQASDFSDWHPPQQVGVMIDAHHVW